MAQYQSSLTGPEIDAALTDMARHDSEAWAVGTRDGEAVSSLDITYHNNAEYYATNAQAAAARAEAAVPSGTAGAVFFDRSQTLTEAQQGQARTNIDAQETINDTLQFENTLAIGARSFTTENVQTGGVGWYRVADIDLERAGAAGSIYHGTGLLLLGGFYASYKPSKGVFAFTYDGGGGANDIVQLGGVGSTSPTQIRMSNTVSGHPLGQGHLLIDLYFSDTRNIRLAPSIIVTGARAITMQDPELIEGTPTGEAVRATLDIKTIKTGAVGGGVLTTPAIVTVSDIAALKTQLTTWRIEQGGASVGFYLVRFSAAASPFVSGARVNVQLNISEGANGVATLTTYGSSNPEMYLMRLYNGTWGDPKKVTVAS